MSKKNRIIYSLESTEKSNSDSLFNERERAKKRREALLNQKAFERVQNERFGFTKVGNRFGRAVTRYLGFGKEIWNILKCWKVVKILVIIIIVLALAVKY